MTMTVYLVDDDAAVRDSTAMLLEEEGLAVESYAGADAFLAACKASRPGCAIIDLCMPGKDGMQLQAAMADRGINMPIIFLTAHGDVSTTVRAMKAGAFDFLTKPVGGEVLVQTVRAALDAGSMRYERCEASREAAARLDCLTAREQEVMALAVAGKANKTIGKELGISHRTVEIHRARVMSKTGATTLFELACLVDSAARAHRPD